VFNTKAGAKNSATREAVRYFLEAYRRTLFPGPLQLPALCQKYGLEDIAEETFSMDQYPDFDKVRSQGRGFLSGALTAMLPLLLKDQSIGLTEEHAKEVIKQSMEELEGDVFIHDEVQLIVRRKRILSN